MSSNGIYTNNREFDPLGNVTAGSQLTASKQYPFLYTYNLAGALTSEMLPSGRKLVYGYDGAGRENYLSGTIAGQPKNYVTYLSYTPDNQAGLIGYGNDVWHATSYNNRLQPAATGANAGCDQQRSHEALADAVFLLGKHDQSANLHGAEQHG
jgi:hypothetical protein